jgi:hypothetical protein
VDEPADEPLLDSQRRRIMALYRGRGIADRAVRLKLASDWVGRELASSKDLTRDEADRVIAVLESLPPTDTPLSSTEPSAEDVPVPERLL